MVICFASKLEFNSKDFPNLLNFIQETNKRLNEQILIDSGRIKHYIRDDHILLLTILNPMNFVKAYYMIMAFIAFIILVFWGFSLLLVAPIILASIPAFMEEYGVYWMLKMGIHKAGYAEKMKMHPLKDFVNEVII